MEVSFFNHQKKGTASRTLLIIPVPFPVLFLRLFTLRLPFLTALQNRLLGLDIKPSPAHDFVQRAATTQTNIGIVQATVPDAG